MACLQSYAWKQRDNPALRENGWWRYKNKRNGWLPSSVIWKKDDFQKIGMKHRRYKSKLLTLSLLTMPSTDEDTLSPISVVLTRKKPTMYFERYMKGFEVTMQEQDLWREKHLVQDITGQRYKRMHMTSSKHVTNANASRTSKWDQVSQWRQ